MMHELAAAGHIQLVFGVDVGGGGWSVVTRLKLARDRDGEVEGRRWWRGFRHAAAARQHSFSRQNASGRSHRAGEPKRRRAGSDLKDLLIDSLGRTPGATTYVGGSAAGAAGGFLRMASRGRWCTCPYMRTL
jgi:hypothetical protein